MAKILDKTPAEIVEKHARRLREATPDIRAGIQAVTESPTEKAAAAQDKMLQNLTESVQSGKWARGLKRVSLDMWKEKFLNVGVGRIGPGIDAAREKTEAFFSELVPHIQSGQRNLSAMPTMTLDDNIQRMVSFTRHMAEFKRK